MYENQTYYKIMLPASAFFGALCCLVLKGFDGPTYPQTVEKNWYINL